jgi:hypothetical protein
VSIFPQQMGVATVNTSSVATGPFPGVTSPLLIVHHPGWSMSDHSIGSLAAKNAVFSAYLALFSRNSPLFS